MYKILLILLFAYSLAITTDGIYDNSYALIIGIDKYQNVRSLDYAVKDAEDIQSMLIDKFHFQQDNIVLLKNEEATKTTILQEFSTSLKRQEKMIESWYSLQGMERQKICPMAVKWAIYCL